MIIFTDYRYVNYRLFMSSRVGVVVVILRQDLLDSVYYCTFPHGEKSYVTVTSK